MSSGILATEDEIKEMAEYIRNNKLHDYKVWRTNFLGVPYVKNVVEFDIDEQRMIREMATKTGYGRAEIIREAVRCLWDDICGDRNTKNSILDPAISITGLIFWLNDQKYRNIDENSVNMTEEFEKEHRWELSRNCFINKMVTKLRELK